MSKRRKIVIWVAIIAVAAAAAGVWLYLSSNPKNSEPSIHLGTYVLQDSSVEDLFLPKITLKENNEFVFAYSLLSSYLDTGSYRTESDRLILTTSDGWYTYAFRIDGESLIFLAAQSSVPRVYANERPVINGDVFK